MNRMYLKEGESFTAFCCRYSRVFSISSCALLGVCAEQKCALNTFLGLRLLRSARWWRCWGSVEVSMAPVSFFAFFSLSTISMQRSVFSPVVRL
jgi:hypothetical protein